MKDLTYLDRMRKYNPLYGTSGDKYNGCFEVKIKDRAFYVVASNGGGWDHVSVSRKNGKSKACPTWEEMCAIKDMFFEPEECVVEYHPAKSDYINDYEYCLHLWRPQEQVVPTQPKIFV